MTEWQMFWFPWLIILGIIAIGCILALIFEKEE